MAVFLNKNVKISGISACVPQEEISNMNYDWISEKERALFIQTTGIEKRRIAPEGICTSDMCQMAAEKLIADLKWNKEDINLLIFVSQSADYYLPASSILLQNRLGLSKNTMAFDINLGCSGYVYGMAVITALLSNGHFKKGLLLVGDKSSYSLNPKDKTTYPLFGDAGTATALEFCEGEEMFFNLQSDGSGKEAIYIPGGGTREPFNYTLLTEEEQEPGVIRHRCNLHLNGLDVFNFSLREVKPNIDELMKNIQINQDTIDYFVLHQANKFMNESVRKKMKIDPEKVPYSLQKFGNTSSASIPLTMVSEMQKDLRSKDLSILLSGFGVGFSWGSVYLKSKHIVCSDLIYC